MKKVAIFFLSIAACFICSCNKEANLKNSIEGTWGLVSYDIWHYEDGFVVSRSRGDCNPYSPSTDEDLKLSIINTTGSTYLITPYSWSKNKKSWQAGAPITWQIQGGNFTQDDHTDGSITISSSELRITFKTEYTTDGTMYNKTGTISIKNEGNYWFRKLGDLSE